MIRIHSVLAYIFFFFFWGKNPQRKVKWITPLGEPVKAANAMCIWNRAIHDKNGSLWMSKFIFTFVVALFLASFIHWLFFLLDVITYVSLRRSISSGPLGKVPDSNLITKLIQDLHLVPEAPEIVCVCVCVAQSCPTLCDPPWDCSPPWNFPGKNTGVGCHSLLQGTLPYPGMEPRSPALQADSSPSEPPGKHLKLQCLH